MAWSPLTPEERAVALAIAKTVDLAKPLPDAPVGEGIAWLQAMHRRQVAAELATILAMEADHTSPEERVAKLGSGWQVRCFGSNETFPTIIKKKGEAVKLARENATTAYGAACDRLREALAAVDADPKE